MSDPTSPTAPDAAAPDVLVDHDHDLAAVVRAASIDEGSPGALYRCGPEAVAACVRALAADNERLREGFGRAVDAHEDDALAVWRALGGTHEPPDDTATIIDAIERLTAALARLRAPADLAAIGARAAAASPRAVAYSYEGTTRGDPPRHQYSICNGTWQDEDTRPHKCIAMVYSDTEEDTADVVFFVNARHDVLSLLALLAADRERHAAEVAGARAAALREAAAACANLADGYGATDSDAMAFACADAIDALATKGAPDV